MEEILLEKISKDVVDIKKRLIELEEYCLSNSSSSMVYRFFSFDWEE